MPKDTLASLSKTIHALCGEENVAHFVMLCDREGLCASGGFPSWFAIDDNAIRNVPEEDMKKSIEMVLAFRHAATRFLEYTDKLVGQATGCLEGAKLDPHGMH